MLLPSRIGALTLVLLVLASTLTPLNTVIAQESPREKALEELSRYIQENYQLAIIGLYRGPLYESVGVPLTKEMREYDRGVRLVYGQPVIRTFKVEGTYLIKDVSPLGRLEKDYEANIIIDENLLFPLRLTPLFSNPALMDDYAQALQRGEDADTPYSTLIESETVPEGDFTLLEYRINPPLGHEFKPTWLYTLYLPQPGEKIIIPKGESVFITLVPKKESWEETAFLVERALEQVLNTSPDPGEAGGLLDKMLADLASRAGVESLELNYVSQTRLGLVAPIGIDTYDITRPRADFIFVAISSSETRDYTGEGFVKTCYENMQRFKQTTTGGAGRFPLKIDIPVFEIDVDACMRIFNPDITTGSLELSRINILAPQGIPEPTHTARVETALPLPSDFLLSGVFYTISPDSFSGDNLLTLTVTDGRGRLLASYQLTLSIGKENYADLTLSDATGLAVSTVHLLQRDENTPPSADLSQRVSEVMRARIELTTGEYNTYGAFEVLLTMEQFSKLERNYLESYTSHRAEGMLYDMASYTLRAIGSVGGYLPNPFPPGNTLLLNYNSTWSRVSNSIAKGEMYYWAEVPLAPTVKTLTRECIYGVDPPSWVPWNELRQYCSVLREQPVYILSNLDTGGVIGKIPLEPNLTYVKATASVSVSEYSTRTLDEWGLLLLTLTPDPTLGKILTLQTLSLGYKDYPGPSSTLESSVPPMVTLCEYREDLLSLEPPPYQGAKGKAKLRAILTCYMKPSPSALVGLIGTSMTFTYFWHPPRPGQVSIQMQYTSLGGYYPQETLVDTVSPEVHVEVRVPQERVSPMQARDQGVDIEVRVCLANTPEYIGEASVRIDAGVQESLEVLMSKWVTIPRDGCAEEELTLPLFESAYAREVIQLLLEGGLEDPAYSFQGPPIINLFAQTTAYDEQDVLFASGKDTASVYIETQMNLAIRDVNYPLDVTDVLRQPLTLPISTQFLDKLESWPGPLPLKSLPSVPGVKYFTLLMAYAVDEPDAYLEVSPLTPVEVTPLLALYYDPHLLLRSAISNETPFLHPSGEAYTLEQVLESLASSAGPGPAADTLDILRAFKALNERGLVIDLLIYYDDGVVPLKELLETYAGLGEGNKTYIIFSLTTFAVTVTDDGYYVAPYLNTLFTGPLVRYSEGDISVWSEEKRAWVYEEGASLQIMVPLSLLATLSKAEALLAGFRVDGRELSFLLSDQKVILALEPLDWLVNLVKPLVEKVPGIVGFTGIEYRKEFNIFTLSSNIHLRSDPLLSLPKYYKHMVSMYSADSGLGGKGVINQGITDPGGTWQGLAKAAFYLTFQAKYQRNAQIMSSVAAKYIVLPFLLSYYFDYVFGDYTLFGKKMAELGIKDFKSGEKGAAIKKWQLGLIVSEAMFLAVNSLASMFGVSVFKLFNIDPETLSLIIAGSFKVIRLGFEVLFIKVLGPRALVEDLSFEIIYQLLTLVISHLLYTFYQATLYTYLQNNLLLITMPSSIDLASVIGEFSRLEKLSLTLGVVWMGFVLNKASTLVSLVRGLDGIFFYDIKHKQKSFRDYMPDTPIGRFFYKVYQSSSKAIVGFFEKSLAHAYRAAGLDKLKVIAAYIDLKENEIFEKRLTHLEAEYLQSKGHILTEGQKKTLVTKGLSFDKKLKNSVSRLVLSGGTMLTALIASQSLTMWMAGSVLINPTNPTLTRGLTTLTFALEAFLIYASFVLGIKGLALTKIGGVILKSLPPSGSQGGQAATLARIALAGPLTPALDATLRALETPLASPLEQHGPPSGAALEQPPNEAAGPLAERLRQLAQEINQTYSMVREGLSTARVSLDALGRYKSLLDEAQTLARLLQKTTPSTDPLAALGVAEEIVGLEWAASTQILLLETTLAQSYPRPLPSDLESLDMLTSAIIDSLQLLSRVASMAWSSQEALGPLITLRITGVSPGKEGVRVEVTLTNYGGEQTRPSLVGVLYPSLREVKVPPPPLIAPGESVTLTILVTPGQAQEDSSLELRLVSPTPGVASLSLAGLLAQEARVLEGGIRLTTTKGEAVLNNVREGRLQVSLNGVESLFARVPHSVLLPPVVAMVDGQPLPVLELVGESESIYIVGGPLPLTGLLTLESAAVETQPVKAGGGEKADTGLGVVLEPLGEGVMEGVVTLVERNPYAEAEEQARELGLSVYVMLDITATVPVRVTLDYRSLGYTGDAPPVLYKYRSELEAYVPLPTKVNEQAGTVTTIVQPGDPLLALGLPAPVPVQEPAQTTPPAPTETMPEVEDGGQYQTTAPAPQREEGEETPTSEPGKDSTVTGAESSSPTVTRTERGDEGGFTAGLVVFVIMAIAAVVMGARLLRSRSGAPS